ncbi:hypothetical protein [Flavobacterium sp. MMS24-S5]|uniref:hypothetical protein n=1 Tax=Flavobacterium sp. MMS24-S5 TaxID=3416605 RepID=UPI003D02280D
MTPDETGRFCRVCNKSVIDFTSKLPEEIQHFFLQNQDQKICGRFKNSQLDSVSIQIPSQILFSQTQYHKMFLLALFVTMGTSLFSCSSVNGNKQKIQMIEVVNQQKTSSLNNSKTQTDSKKNEINSVKIGNGEATMEPMPIEVNFGLEKELLKSEDIIINKIEIGDINLTSLKSQIGMPRCKPQLKFGKQ